MFWCTIYLLYLKSAFFLTIFDVWVLDRMKWNVISETARRVLPRSTSNKDRDKMICFQRWCGKYCDMLQFCDKLYGYQCHHATDKIISVSWTQNISHNKLLQWPTGTSQIMAKGNVHHDVYNDVYNMTSFMQYTILLKIKI